MRDINSAGIDDEPPRIRALRRLVTLLTVTLTLGMVIVVGLLIWRIALEPMPVLPGAVALPAGERLTGYAQNPDWVVLITEDVAGVQRVHLVPAGEDTIRQSMEIGIE